MCAHSDHMHRLRMCLDACDVARHMHTRRVPHHMYVHPCTCAMQMNFAQFSDLSALALDLQAFIESGDEN